MRLLSIVSLMLFYTFSFAQAEECSAIDAHCEMMRKTLQILNDVNEPKPQSDDANKDGVADNHQTEGRIKDYTKTCKSWDENCRSACGNGGCK